jgi:anti-sigma factor RsiW
VTTHEVTCQQFVERITGYLEGILAPRTTGQIEEHLVMCDWCVIYMEQMELTVASLRGLREPAVAEPPAALVAAVQARRAPG